MGLILKKLNIKKIQSLIKIDKKFFFSCIFLFI